MTNQELFNNAWNHHVVNKEPPSFKYEGVIGCLYRGPNGEKCAIGVSIPDKEYDKSMEGRAASALLQSNACPKSLIGYDNNQLSFADQLQYAHDNSARRSYSQGKKFTDMVKEEYEMVAYRWGLKVP